MNPVRVFTCEAQPIVVEGLARVLAADAEFEYIGSTPNLSEALEAVRESCADVLLIDHSSGLRQIFQVISDVKSTLPRCHPVLWINDLAEIDCFRALQLGARGILKKTVSVASIKDCLRAVGRGEVWIENSLSDRDPGASDRRTAPHLTPRERDIIQHICVGLKNKEIADALAITAGTVKVHLMHIFEKTGVKDRFELAAQGRRLVGSEPVQEVKSIS